MEEEHPNSMDPESPSLAQRIDAMCRRFEREWPEEHPEIDALLGEIEESERRVFFRGLLALELELRMRRGEWPTLAEYQARYPDKVDILETLFRDIDGSFDNSRVQGQKSPGQNQVPGATTSTSAGLVDAADRPTQIATLIPENEAAGLRVEIVAGPHRGVRMDFYRRATLLVGRGDDTGLQLLDDPYFSRHHFQLEFDPPSCRLRDMGSSNGTQVNGRRVMDCFLHDGDEISGGQTRILFSELSRPVTTQVDQPTGLPETCSFEPAMTDPRESSGTTNRAPLLQPPGFEILRSIGAGAMGSVYLARQRSTGREFALKLILPEAALSPNALTLFLREVSVLSQLDHPRIVRFFEIGETQGQFYFVMEYVPAIDLRSLMDSTSDCQRVALACSVIAVALEGLGYAHDRGIIHRDFKPSNLLVKWEGGLPMVKVADFGLAKSFMSAGFSGITPEARILGTLAYMAPEQALDSRFVRPAADLYSAGATLYDLLAGRPPYQFGLAGNALAIIAQNDPVPLTQLRPDLPPGLTGIVHRALARRPEERFPSAAEMRLALLPFAEGLVPRSLPPSVRLRG